jgi:L-ascorbate 6-phosphate lactonase
MDSLIEVMALGQTGYRFQFGRHFVYVDPYLSNSVQDWIGNGGRRMIPAPLVAGEIRDASWVLITNAHLDHCDPETLRPLALASPTAQFLAPKACHPILESAGILACRIVSASSQPLEFLPGLEIQALPAAHPTVELDADGQPECVGYLLRFAGHQIFHAGDTVAHDDLIRACKAAGPIDWAFLPVNETNYFRTRANIIGNMSPREAMGLAGAIGARYLVPTHWDLFPDNSVPAEEIQLVYRFRNWGSVLNLIRCGQTVRLYPTATE